VVRRGGRSDSRDSVKAYASVRYGASNEHNVPGESGLPYLFGGNERNIDVAWDFTTDGVDGKYNHTLDIFFNASANTKQTEIRGEIMVVTASSQDARTQGWASETASRSSSVPRPGIYGRPRRHRMATAGT
jgi:hypothetical protein